MYSDLSDDAMELIIADLSSKNAIPHNLQNLFIDLCEDNCHHKYIEKLLKYETINFSVDNNNLIKYVSDKGYVEVVKILLEINEVDPTVEDNYAIRRASVQGHTETVKVLLETNRVDPTVKNNYAIRKASSKGHTEIVKLLLKCEQIDPGANYNYAIRKASSKGHTEIVEQLLQCDKVDPGANDNYAIRMASLYGHIEIVKQLLQCDKVDPTGHNNSAIKYALKNGHMEIVKLLLECDKVDPMEKKFFICEDGKLSYNALLYTALKGNVDFCKLLLTNSKLKIEECVCDALVVASENGKIEVVKLLLPHLPTSYVFENVIKKTILSSQYDIYKLLISHETNSQYTKVDTKKIISMMKLSNILKIKKNKNGVISVTKIFSDNDVTDIGLIEMMEKYDITKIDISKNKNIFTFVQID